MNELENDDYLSKYIPVNFTGLIIDSSNLNSYKNSIKEIEKDYDDYYNKITIHLFNYEDVLSVIRNIVGHRPDVIVIDGLKLPEVYNAIYDSSYLFAQYNYILEIANSEYCLVNRDCYFKENSK